MSAHTVIARGRQGGKYKSLLELTLYATACGAQVHWVSQDRTLRLPRSSSTTSSHSPRAELKNLPTEELSVQTATTRGLTELEEMIDMMAVAFMALEEELEEVIDTFAEIIALLMLDMEQEEYDMARAGAFNREPWVTVPEAKVYSTGDVDMVQAGRF